ncbi:NAD(P)H-dependent oxidoreductase subunit E [Myxococcota bacterium]|nr:NAD(P)H-dependent oxidoreductase subunit E [Myxococcota bacterium]MBU1431916.1 NAD(P)H-dependent oxidoreductase subunit E [Myxococcota bacterium]MBU1900426.1 NAD(P)H-dependent oxidoreductase subunit E [Myxococcota bacterium]
MSEILSSQVRAICREYADDRTRMMDIVRAVQAALGYVPSEALDLIAEAVGSHRVEVESVVSFYAFFSKTPKGKVIVRLCDDIVDEMAGSAAVAEVFKAGLGIDFGQTTPDGAISLEWTPCIGMCDQAPAAMVNEVIVTSLSTDSARAIVEGLKTHGDPKRLIRRLGDGNNAHPLIHAAVVNHLRQPGAVIFAGEQPGEALRKALSMSPVEVIREVKASRLRGRGGAGFPTGMKWAFTRDAEGEDKIIICNADEGEPGTFKDRVILTERANLLFEGMAIGGYAIGAAEGLVYLRGEYAYLKPYLEHVLAQRRASGLLGKDICGQGFDFDIRIQMGAGAYICGEETALISSCEGLRGDPKNRPPFPAQKGYLGRPTSVNNVETLCCVARVLQHGAGWFAQFGSKGSAGTKLLSVSGDCASPGVYEFPFGVTLREVLRAVGAEDAAAVQVGGPSGQLVPPARFDEIICYDHLATGGAVVVFGPQRDLLHVVAKYLEFFVEESCGFCTPCRVGNVLLKNQHEKFVAGRADLEDLAQIKEIAQTVKATSRCGLGQTSPNPVLSLLRDFPQLYEANIKPAEAGLRPSFDIKGALKTASDIIGRESRIY